MRQAIQTRYFGPTDTKGSRIKAFAFSGATTVSRDDDQFSERERTIFAEGLTSIERAHARAAYAHALKMEWFGIWVGGGAPDERGNVFVCVESNPTRGDVIIARAGQSFAFVVEKTP